MTSLFAGKIAVGAEVTIGQPERDQSFGTIKISGGEAEDCIYTVLLADGKTEADVKRSDLRHRKWHTIAFCGATRDMKQDAYATQHFVGKENEWWDEQYVKTKKEPTTRSYTHSDNAYHFKSAKCMNFLSRATPVAQQG